MVLIVKEARVLVFFYGRLHLIQCLLYKDTVLDVDDPVSIALDLRVVGDHHAGCRGVLALSLGTNPVDVQNEVHDLHSRP